jgi:hypothetical protein
LRKTAWSVMLRSSTPLAVMRIDEDGSSDLLGLTETTSHETFLAAVVVSGALWALAESKTAVIARNAVEHANRLRINFSSMPTSEF